MPLSAVAHFVNEVQPLTVNHQGVFPAVTLSFSLAPGVAPSQAVDTINAMEAQLQPLASRAAIEILLGQVDEVRLAEAAIGLSAGVIGFGSVTVMPACSRFLNWKLWPFRLL